LFKKAIDLNLQEFTKMHKKLTELETVNEQNESLINSKDLELHKINIEN